MISILSEGFDFLFEPVDLISSTLESFAQFNDADGRIDNSGRHRYAPAIVNPRGSILVLNERLRNRVFGKRLEIFLHLAEDRLERLAADLAQQRREE